jgi:hypothetical protein
MSTTPTLLLAIRYHMCGRDSRSTLATCLCNNHEVEVSIVVLSNLSLSCPHGVVPNKVDASVIHAKAKHKQASRNSCMPVQSSTANMQDEAVVSCSCNNHQAGVSITMLPNMSWCCPHSVLLNNVVAGVMHTKAKGLLVFFGCSVGSCHTCLCNKNLIAATY